MSMGKRVIIVALLLGAVGVVFVMKRRKPDVPSAAPPAESVALPTNADAGAKYGIRIIPTQIFYDAAGKELFRHEGFFGREDILAKWKEFGVDVPAVEEP